MNPTRIAGLAFLMIVIPFSRADDAFFSIRLRPAFLRPERSFHFKTEDETGILVVTDYSGEARPEKKYRVSNIVLERLRRRISMADSLKNRDPKSCGAAASVLDGITVSGFYESGGNSSSFEFRISNQNTCPKNYFLAKSAFDALEMLELPADLKAYVEQASLYFPFREPIRIVEDSIYTIRILQLTVSDTAELENSVAGCPKGKKILFDFRNFSGMGTMFYPYLKGLQYRNDVYWIADPDSKWIFEKIGIEKYQVVQTR
jgi:hypothetical protein